MGVLEEPSKPETRIGWWFMLKFRRREVVVRTARNRVMAEAWLASDRYDLPELRDAINAYSEAQETRDLRAYSLIRIRGRRAARAASFSSSGRKQP